MFEAFFKTLFGKREQEGKCTFVRRAFPDTVVRFHRIEEGDYRLILLDPREDLEAFVQFTPEQAAKLVEHMAKKLTRDGVPLSVSIPKHEE